MADRDWDLVDFAEGKQAAQLKASSPWLGLFLLVIFSLLAAFLVWASSARIEEVARAEGRVVPSGYARTVETLEGGIIRDILVSEGETVSAGQILVQLDDTGSGANLGELRAQERALNARAIRLEAELLEEISPDFSRLGLPNDDPLTVRETALFESRTASHIGQRAVLKAQISQRAQEIVELEASMERVAENIALLDEEIDIKTQSGIVPRAQILPIERERTARRQEQDGLLSRREQARSALAEAEARLDEAELQRRAEINLERSDTLNQLSIVEESVKRASDIVSRTALKAPVNGVVSALNVFTIGAVVAPGEEVMRIVPEDDRLQVEARVRPEDIAFIRPGLAAQVKLTSFDFTVYGSLNGSVTRIGADSEQDETTGEVFFPVVVETQKDTLTRNGETHDVLPGMVASVDVMTGERTVLDYILKPFRKAQQEALRER